MNYSGELSWVCRNNVHKWRYVWTFDHLPASINPEMLPHLYRSKRTCLISTSTDSTCPRANQSKGPGYVAQRETERGNDELQDIIVQIYSPGIPELPSCFVLCHLPALKQIWSGLVQPQVRLCNSHCGVTLRHSSYVALKKVRHFLLCWYFDRCHQWWCEKCLNPRFVMIFEWGMSTLNNLLCLRCCSCINRYHHHPLTVIKPHWWWWMIKYPYQQAFCSRQCRDIFCCGMFETIRLERGA